jgi:hypothetical protein
LDEAAVPSDAGAPLDELEADAAGDAEDDESAAVEESLLAPLPDFA